MRAALITRLAPLPNARVARRLCGSWAAFADELENALIAELVLSDLPLVARWDAPDVWSYWKAFENWLPPTEERSFELHFDFVAWLARVGTPQGPLTRARVVHSRMESLLFATSVMPTTPIERLVEFLAYVVEHEDEDSWWADRPRPRADDLEEVIEAMIRRTRALGASFVRRGAETIYEAAYPAPTGRAACAVPVDGRRVSEPPPF